MFRNFFWGGGWGSTEVMGNAMKHVSMEEVGVWGEGGGVGWTNGINISN